MGVDVKGYLKRNVSIFAVRNFIEAYFEVEVELESGRMFFPEVAGNEYKRSLQFYTYDSDIEPSQHPDDFPIVVSLGLSGNAQEIIKKIIEEFGGWYQKNDCNDNPCETEYGLFYSGHNPKYQPSDDDKLLVMCAKQFGHENASSIANIVNKAMEYGRRGGRNLSLFVDENK